MHTYRIEKSQCVLCTHTHISFTRFPAHFCGVFNQQSSTAAFAAAFFYCLLHHCPGSPCCWIPPCWCLIPLQGLGALSQAQVAALSHQLARDVVKVSRCRRSCKKALQFCSQPWHFGYVYMFSGTGMVRGSWGGR